MSCRRNKTRIQHMHTHIGGEGEGEGEGRGEGEGKRRLVYVSGTTRTAKRCYCYCTNSEDNVLLDLSDASWLDRRVWRRKGKQPQHLPLKGGKGVRKPHRVHYVLCPFSRMMCLQVKFVDVSTRKEGGERQTGWTCTADGLQNNF